MSGGDEYWEWDGEWENQRSGWLSWGQDGVGGGNERDILKEWDLIGLG